MGIVEDRDVGHRESLRCSACGSKSTKSAAEANTVPLLMTSPTVAVGVLAAVLTLFLLADQAAIATPDQFLPADPVLEPGESLVPGQSVASTNGRFQLVFQRDGNLVVLGDGSVQWTSGTAGLGADRVVMQRNGVLEMFRSLQWGTESVWKSRTVGADGAVLR